MSCWELGTIDKPLPIGVILFDLQMTLVFLPVHAPAHLFAFPPSFSYFIDLQQLVHLQEDFNSWAGQMNCRW